MKYVHTRNVVFQRPVAHYFTKKKQCSYAFVPGCGNLSIRKIRCELYGLLVYDTV